MCWPHLHRVGVSVCHLAFILVLNSITVGYPHLRLPPKKIRDDLLLLHEAKLNALHQALVFAEIRDSLLIFRDEYLLNIENPSQIRDDLLIMSTIDRQRADNS